jgi:hypothetical protein
MHGGGPRVNGRLRAAGGGRNRPEGAAAADGRQRRGFRAAVTSNYRATPTSDASRPSTASASGRIAKSAMRCVAGGAFFAPPRRRRRITSGPGGSTSVKLEPAHQRFTAPLATVTQVHLVERVNSELAAGKPFAPAPGESFRPAGSALRLRTSKRGRRQREIDARASWRAAARRISAARRYNRSLSISE